MAGRDLREGAVHQNSHALLKPSRSDFHEARACRTRAEGQEVVTGIFPGVVNPKVPSGGTRASAPEEGWGFAGLARLPLRPSSKAHTPILALEPHFSTSADFMMWVLEAVSFQGPKEKSWWLLWKPWIIMAAERPAGDTRNGLEHGRQRRQIPVPPPPSSPAAQTSEPLPCPAPPRPAPPRPLPATRTQALLSASSVPRLFASGTSCRGYVTHVLRHDAPEKGGETLLRGEASAAGDGARGAHIIG